MDATAAVVILLFVVTIFSASMKGGGPFAGRSTTVVNSNVDAGTLPDPTYMGVVGESTQDKIENFILSSYKKVSPWDANLMAASMVRYGQQYNVNPKLVAALVARESSFNSQCVSPSGAQGLGQLLPPTAQSLNITNSFDIDQNLMGTTRYVRLMLDRWSGNPQQVPLALASYAEGYGAVSRNGGYKDCTKQYVQDIIRFYWQI
jgi:hypothetical protein